MIGDVWFYVNSILIVIILSFVIPFIKMKYWWVTPLAALIIMTLAGFILPNFYDELSWQPLLGYAVFLTVLSIVVTILTFMFVRNRKRKKKAKQEKAAEVETHEQIK